MIITAQDLGMHAQRFLEKLKEDGIDSIEFAKRLIGQEINVRENPLNYIHFFTSPSNHATTALKLSYTCPDREGIPIELVINPALEYRQTIIKCEEPVNGYRLFGVDDFGNIQQFKKTESPKWREVIGDLEELTRLK